MNTITTTVPEINFAQKPVARQEAAANAPGTTPGSNTYEEGSEFDSLIKDNIVPEESETELQDNLQGSLQGEDTPKTDGPITFVIAAETEIQDTAGTSPGVGTPQTKNNPLIIKLPATGSPGEMLDINAGTKLPATGSPGEMLNINAGTKGPGHEINQSQEETTVLSVLKNQQRVIDTSAENEDLEMAFREMAGKGGKEIKNFTPSNVEDTVGKTLFKNQSDISAKHSDQPGRISEIENTNPGNSSTITSGGQKTAEKPFLETVQRPSGFNEVLDKIVYVVKNNRSMDVSVMHKGNRLNINLTMDNGLLNVNINTNEAAMKELIENNMRDMMDNLEKDGVNISKFSVNLKERRDNNNRENNFNRDIPVRGFTPPAHIMSANSGTGVVNIFV